MDYRIMIHPSGEIDRPLRKQLSHIASRVYGKNIEEVIYRIRATQNYENRRKLFIPGNGEVVELCIHPHVTFSQKIEIDERDESKICEKLSQVVKINSFNFVSNYLGDYGENFTIFLAFEQNEKADELEIVIDREFQEFFPKEKEQRDMLHTTLMYDDADETNFKKAWKLIDKEELMNKKFFVDSLWLWKGWAPYKEFKFVTGI